MDGWIGTVVAVLPDVDGSAGDWSLLDRGLVIHTVDAGHVHYPDLDGLEIELLSD